MTLVNRIISLSKIQVLILQLSLLLVTSVSHSLEVLKIDTGRYVSVEENIIDSTKPTLVLLPGVFRALDSRDEFIQLAKKLKISFISIHTSLHPESVKEIPKNEVPYFKFKKVTSTDLASEVVSVIEYYGLENPIPVSLSYSSTISSALASNYSFPLIIETAPMIRFDESDPSGSQITQFWKNYFDLFPIYGGFWKEAYLKQTYEYYWSNEINNLLKRYPEYNTPELKSKLVSAYASLSIAADGFDYRKQKFTKQTKRLFILGEQEEARRFELQKEAIELYQNQTGDLNSVELIPGAGHIVPSDAPTEYIRLLQKRALRKK